jgi:pimeloyl-ACP methyl ester carboxylesterase
MPSVLEPGTSRPATREPWQHRWAVVNGVRLHYVEAGSGPPVLLLHGFPEFWHSWRHQLPALADAGFHAVAVDLRGYNESDRPGGVRNYRMGVLVEDMAGLIGHLGAGPAAVVGHDWGGGIAWQVAMRRPEVVDRLVVLNAPHPAAFRRELRRLRQRLRSWYMLFFQLPVLPEWTLQLGDYALLARAWRRQPVRTGAFTAEDIKRYKRALDRPGALTAALNYYRAAFRFAREALQDDRPITTPTLLIWGEHDPYLDVRLTEGLERWVPHLRVERLPDASHWVQNDAPERVNELILGFLRR